METQQFFKRQNFDELKKINFIFNRICDYGVQTYLIRGCVRLNDNFQTT